MKEEEGGRKEGGSALKKRRPHKDGGGKNQSPLEISDQTFWKERRRVEWSGRSEEVRSGKEKEKEKECA